MGQEILIKIIVKKLDLSMLYFDMDSATKTEHCVFKTATPFIKLDESENLHFK